MQQIKISCKDQDKLLVQKTSNLKQEIINWTAYKHEQACLCSLLIQKIQLWEKINYTSLDLIEFIRKFSDLTNKFKHEILDWMVRFYHKNGYATPHCLSLSNFQLNKNSSKLFFNFKILKEQKRQSNYINQPYLVLFPLSCSQLNWISQKIFNFWINNMKLSFQTISLVLDKILQQNKRSLLTSKSTKKLLNLHFKNKIMQLNQKINRINSVQQNKNQVLIKQANQSYLNELKRQFLQKDQQFLEYCLVYNYVILCFEYTNRLYQHPFLNQQLQESIHQTRSQKSFSSMKSISIYGDETDTNKQNQQQKLIQQNQLQNSLSQSQFSDLNESYSCKSQESNKKSEHHDIDQKNKKYNQDLNIINNLNISTQIVEKINTYQTKNYNQLYKNQTSYQSNRLDNKSTTNRLLVNNSNIQLKNIQSNPNPSQNNNKSLSSSFSLTKLLSNTLLNQFSFNNNQILDKQKIIWEKEEFNLELFWNCYRERYVLKGIFVECLNIQVQQMDQIIENVSKSYNNTIKQQNYILQNLNYQQTHEQKQQQKRNKTQSSKQNIINKIKDRKKQLQLNIQLINKQSNFDLTFIFTKIYPSEKIKRTSQLYVKYNTHLVQYVLHFIAEITSSEHLLLSNCFNSIRFILLNLMMHFKKLILLKIQQQIKFVYSQHEYKYAFLNIRQRNKKYLQCQQKCQLSIKISFQKIQSYKKILLQCSKPDSKQKKSSNIKKIQSLLQKQKQLMALFDRLNDKQQPLIVKYDFQLVKQIYSHILKLMKNEVLNRKVFTRCYQSICKKHQVKDFFKQYLTGDQNKMHKKTNFKNAAEQIMMVLTEAIQLFNLVAYLPFYSYQTERQNVRRNTKQENYGFNDIFKHQRNNYKLNHDNIQDLIQLNQFKIDIYNQQIQNQQVNEPKNIEQSQSLKQQQIFIKRILSNLDYVYIYQRSRMNISYLLQNRNNNQSVYEFYMEFFKYGEKLFTSGNQQMEKLISIKKEDKRKIGDNNKLIYEDQYEDEQILQIHKQRLCIFDEKQCKQYFFGVIRDVCFSQVFQIRSIAKDRQCFMLSSQFLSKYYEIYKNISGHKPQRQKFLWKQYKNDNLPRFIKQKQQSDRRRSVSLRVDNLVKKLQKV